MIEGKKLTKRQAIVLGLTVVVILYGLADFFLFGSLQKKEGGSPGGSTQSEGIKALLAGVASSTSPYMPTGFDAYVIGRAESDWPRDPFMDGKVYGKWFSKEKETVAKVSAEKASFTYSGFLEVNHKRLAIINGMEYGIGDPLEVEGHIVREISPARVVVYRTSDKTTLEVPIQE